MTLPRHIFETELKLQGGRGKLYERGVTGGRLSQEKEAFGRKKVGPHYHDCHGLGDFFHKAKRSTDENLNSRDFDDPMPDWLTHNDGDEVRH